MKKYILTVLIGIAFSLPFIAKAQNCGTISVSGPTTFCQGGSVTLTAPLATSYLWNSGQTTRSIVVTTSGTFTAHVVNASGCTGNTLATKVTVNPLPLDTIRASGPLTFCAGGSVTLTSSQDSLYHWSTGVTTRAITVTASGNYIVTVTNDLKCSAASTVTVITAQPLPSTTVTAGGPITFCQGGSVSLSVPAGNFYHWSSGQTTSSIVVTTNGSYAVTVTGSTGCSAVSNATVVTVKPLPTVTIAPAGKFFCGNVVLTATNDSIYKWNTGAITKSITTNTSGIYSVTVTNDSRCTASASDTITVSSFPSDSITVNGPTVFCQGGSVTLSVPAGNSYHWSNGQTTASIIVNTSGNYSVTVTGSTGCTVSSGSTPVTVNPLPTVTISPAGKFFCGSVVLTASSDSLYKWNTGAITPSITASLSGIYTVTVTNEFHCTASASDTIIVSPLPSDSITVNGPTVFCQGGSVTLSVPPGNSYHWSNGQTTASITVNTSGNYSVTVTGSTGCSASLGGIVVSVNPSPTVILVPNGPLTFCQGGSVVLNAQGSSSIGPVTYVWNSSTQTNPSLTVTTAGNYSVSVYDINDCSASADTTVTITATPPATITPVGKYFCGSIVLTASTDSAYQWNTGAITQSIIATSSGIYSVTVYNDSHCAAVATDTIVVNAAHPIFINANGPTSFCKGDSVVLNVVSIVTSLTDTVTYQWNTGQTSPSITVFASGQYTVTLTDAGGCSASASITISVHQLVNGITIIDSTTNLCESDSLHLTVSGALIYQWSTQQTTPVITIDTPGIYSVLLIDSFRCIMRDTITITKTVNCCNKFTPRFILADSTFCSSDSICFSISGGTDFDIYTQLFGIQVHLFTGSTPFNFCGAIPAELQTSGYYTLVAVIYVRDSSNKILCSDTIKRTIYIKPSCSCACMCAETCPYMHADFTSTVYQGYMVLRDSSIGDPTYDEWFINGQSFVTGPGDSLVYTFQHSGYYQVCLTIHHLVYGSDLCCLSDTCKTIYGPVDTCSILHLNAGFTTSSTPIFPTAVAFTPNSQNAVPNVVIWNFGDSTSITVDSAGTVFHTYPAIGTYQVCVTQIWLLPNNYCCIDSQCVMVNVGVPESLMKTSPNPFKNTLNFQYKVLDNGNIQLELFDAMGQLHSVLINSQYYASGSYTIDFDLSSLAPGIYTYRYKTSDRMESGKIIKQ